MRKRIQFKVGQAPYNAGEWATFEAKQADAYVKNGAAEYAPLGKKELPKAEKPAEATPERVAPRRRKMSE